MTQTKPNLIFIIGSDGAGKTTLAQSLSEKMGYTIKHFSAPKSYQDAKDEYFNFVENTNENIICDRFYEGEAIFAPIYRGYNGSDYFEELEKTISEKFNVILIRLKPSFDTIIERLNERGEDFVKPEDFRYCYDKVDEFYHNSNLVKITLDSGNLDVNELMKRTIFILNYVYNVECG